MLRFLLQQLADTPPLAALVLWLSKVNCGLPGGAETPQISSESRTAAGLPSHYADGHKIK